MTRNELLQSFCDPDYLLVYTHKPFLQGTSVCATDSRRLLILPQNEDDSLSYHYSDKPSLHALLNIETQPLITFTKQQVVEAYANFSTYLLSVDRSCPECGGRGTVDFTYEDRHGKIHELSEDCPECDGECNLPLSHWWSKTKYCLHISEKYSLNFRSLECLKNVMDYFNMDSITLCQSDSPSHTELHAKDDRYHFISAVALHITNQDEEEED